MPKSLKEAHRGITPVKISRLKDALHSWQLQTAKARFSEVFRLARTEGPQIITRRGQEGVVMVPVERLDQLVVRCRQPEESPLVG